MERPEHDSDFGACGIAIVGMGCIFPGGIDSPDALWQFLCEGRDAISEVPPDRWNLDPVYDPDPSTSGKTATRWGGFIADIGGFDESLPIGFDWECWIRLLQSGCRAGAVDEQHRRVARARGHVPAPLAWHRATAIRPDRRQLQRLRPCVGKPENALNRFARLYSADILDRLLEMNFRP
jgi:hypothetical protein